jgi:hypothetical protein
MLNAEQEGALQVVCAFAETIRETTADHGTCPTGPMYAAANAAMGMDLVTFTSIIDMLVSGGMVKRTGSHSVQWVGPKKEKASSE